MNFGGETMRHKIRWIALSSVIVALTVAAILFFTLDQKYDLHYTVSAPQVKAVSYTHLDVYKRQVHRLHS